jgi:hypothetical protein
VSWREDSEVFFLVAIVAVVAFLVARWARRRVREGTGRQAALRAAVVVGVLAATVTAIVVVDRRNDAEREREAQASWRKLDAERQEFRGRLMAAIRAKRLPPVALEMYPRYGLSDGDIIPRPDGDGDQNDVIHLGRDGTTGRKLAWDLDRDGRISRDEREITEEELWNAAASPGPGRRFSPERRREPPGDPA